MSEVLRLAFPVVVSYLGIMLMAFVDLLFVGRVGAVAIGAVGLGTAVFSWVLMFGVGLLTSLDYLVSHAYGAGKRDEGARYLVQATWLSVALGIPLTAFLLLVGAHPAWLGIEGEVGAQTGAYLQILAPSTMFSFLFIAFRQYMQAHGSARAAMVIMILANGINVVANWILVFGHLGFPALGVRGSAIATLVSRFFMMAAMCAVLWVWDSKKNESRLRNVSWSFNRELTRKIVKLGLPSAFQMLLEVGVFAGATVLAARFSANDLAAHQLVLNLASLTFMVPLGIGSAASVLVGQALGRENRAAAREAGWRCLKLGVGFMACSCVALLTFPDLILRGYTSDEGVIEAAKRLLFVAALFQLSDGAQAVATGVLRGTADTRTPLYANLGGHWLVGLPLGIALGFGVGWGVRGMWIGLSAGLTVVAVALVWRWVRTTRGWVSAVPQRN